MAVIFWELAKGRHGQPLVGRHGQHNWNAIPIHKKKEKHGISAITIAVKEVIKKATILTNIMDSLKISRASLQCP